MCTPDRVCCASAEARRRQWSKGARAVLTRLDLETLEKDIEVEELDRLADVVGASQPTVERARHERWAVHVVLNGGTGANTLDYRVTIDDPKTWTKPWSVEFPLKRDAEYQLYEYACHEGNYYMYNALTGARAEERKGAP